MYVLFSGFCQQDDEREFYLDPLHPEAREQGLHPDGPHPWHHQLWPLSLLQHCQVAQMQVDRERESLSSSLDIIDDISPSYHSLQ